MAEISFIRENLVVNLYLTSSIMQAILTCVTFFKLTIFVFLVIVTPVFASSPAPTAEILQNVLSNVLRPTFGEGMAYFSPGPAQMRTFPMGPQVQTGGQAQSQAQTTGTQGQGGQNPASGAGQTQIPGVQLPAVLTFGQAQGFISHAQGLSGQTQPAGGQTQTTTGQTGGQPLGTGDSNQTQQPGGQIPNTGPNAGNQNQQSRNFRQGKLCGNIMKNKIF